MRVHTPATPLFVHLESGNGIPLFQQVYQGIREAILSGRIRPDSQLPSTRVLAGELQVSRSTLTLAYRHLTAEGLLVGQVGSGSFVARGIPDAVVQRATGIRFPLPRIEPATELSSLRAPGRRLPDSSTGPGNLRPRATAFRVGEPDLPAFEYGTWERLVRRVWRREPHELLRDGPPEGYRPLREAIADYVRAARGVNASAEQVIVVRGAQHGIDLAARVLVERGQQVCVEDPGYEYAAGAFESVGATIVPVPVDAEGLKVRDAISLSPAVRLIYVTPSHQFPTGAALSQSRRTALLQWAARSGAWIVEDDYDSEFLNDRRPLASLQGLDPTGRVIYVGTFSKTIFPSLRLGYMIVPRNMVDAFVHARGVSDRHSPVVDQAVVADFIREGHLARHVRRMRVIYAERQRTLKAALRRSLSGVIEATESECAMHLVGWLPPGVSDQAVAAELLTKGIETMPISRLSRNPGARGGLVLGFAAIPPAELERGVARLREVLLGRVRQTA